MLAFDAAVAGEAVRHIGAVGRDGQRVTLIRCLVVPRAELAAGSERGLPVRLGRTEDLRDRDPGQLRHQQRRNERGPPDWNRALSKSARHQPEQDHRQQRAGEDVWKGKNPGDRHPPHPARQVRGEAERSGHENPVAEAVSQQHV